MKAVAAIVLGLSTTAQALACGTDDDIASTNAPPTATLALPEGGIKVGAPFSLTFRICDPAWQGIAVDARMPAHGHGMNYSPGVSSTDRGGIAEGMLFHMPGLWEVRLEMTNGTDTRGAIFEIAVTP